MTRYDLSKEMLALLFLTSPEETEDELVITSMIACNDDGSFSFEVSTEDGKHKWKHTCKTEEV